MTFVYTIEQRNRKLIATKAYAQVQKFVS